MFGVRLYNQSRNSQPRFVVNAQTAQYWLDCQWAWRLNRWTIVLKKPLPLKLRGASCSMRESTVIAAMLGSRYHRSLMEAWR